VKVQDISRMFEFTFQKTTTDIRHAARKKITAIQAKIEERQARIKALRAEHKITDAVLNDILSQMRATTNAAALIQYTSSVTTDAGSAETVIVGAGAVNFLLTEQDYIEGERSPTQRKPVCSTRTSTTNSVTRNSSSLVSRRPQSCSLVDCPDCHASVGQRCVDVPWAGEKIGSWHKKRCIAAAARTREANRITRRNLAKR
jgi:hypothetical protein